MCVRNFSKKNDKLGDYVVNFAYKRSGERSLQTLRGFDYSLLVTKWVGAAEISEPGGAS